MIILGIESSCDETSASVVENGQILSNVISSQWVHQQYGGVVPEISARAHLRLISQIVESALEKSGKLPTDINAVAVTYGPGLIGSLLVGVNFAKSYAWALDKPLIGINHIESHLYANFADGQHPDFPFIGLIVSGGHTVLVKVEKGFQYQVLGATRDDAAGEAFDKIGKLLGLGYPGGPVVDQLAKEGQPNFFEFPRPMKYTPDFEFSFSGLKTAVLQFVKKHPEALTTDLANICASVQVAIVDVLVTKSVKAIREFHIQDLVVAGGVSANSELRKQLQMSARKVGFRVFLPPPILSTDNAAMVALLGELKWKAGISSQLNLSPKPNLSFSV